MKARICIAIVTLSLTGGIAAAVDDRTPAPQAGGLFQGTPEEQVACRSDATRFCSQAFPDSFRVLDCLRQHQSKLRKACRAVLEAHGQLPAR
jgi:hypothetical protein